MQEILLCERRLDSETLVVTGGGVVGLHMTQAWKTPHRAADAIPNGHTGGPTSDVENRLPCQYFDFIYGTSTGGLIGTMLGRLRMGVDQCLDIYIKVGEHLFGRQRSRIPLTTKYHHKPLEIAVRDIVKAHCKQHMRGGECDGEDWFPWDSDIQNKADVDFNKHICQSVCLTATHNGKIDEAHLLRTYNHKYVDIPNWITPYNEGADMLRIWQVTRATSAAPFYFDILEADIRGEKVAFKDGGIRENNPAGAAWSEFVSLYGEGKDPALLLSIGTGRPDESQDGFAAAWPGPFGRSTLVRKAAEKFAVIKNVLIKYTDGEEKHRDLVNTARGEHMWYKRLNVSSGLESLPLDDWRKGEWTNPTTGLTAVVAGGRTLTQMEEATATYLARDIDHRFDSYAPPRTILAQAAEKLVRQRRARQAAAATHEKRWDTYMGHYMTGEYVKNADGPILHSVKVKTPIAAS